MRRSIVNSLLNPILGVLALAGAGLAAAPAQADTKIISAAPPVAWVSNGQSSKRDGTPVIVDSLQVGDIIDVQVATGAHHGFITIKQLADVDDNQTTDPVLACGEDKAQKPNAVLRETECGAASNFGHAFTGSMKLEVLDTFTNDLNFWCTEHGFLMTGTLKLKPKT